MGLLDVLFGSSGSDEKCKTCSTCGGKGYTNGDKSKTCSNCDGKGYEEHYWENRFKKGGMKLEILYDECRYCHKKIRTNGLISPDLYTN